MRIALIGHGGIASYAAKAWRDDGDITLAAVICRPGREDAARAAIAPQGDAGLAVIDKAADLPSDIDLVIDCGGHAALNAHGPDVLRRGIDLVSVSSGVLSDPGSMAALEDAARTGNARLRFLSGAIGAVDAIAAAAAGGLTRLTYTGRKAPGGWKGSPAEDVLDLDSLTEAAVHFSGTARDAAARYPKNANVAATVAFAGPGLDDTQVTLIADPAMTTNRHEIVAQGAFGRMTLVMDGDTLPGSPRTSALTAMSVVAHVRQRLARVSVAG